MIKKIDMEIIVMIIVMLLLIVGIYVYEKNTSTSQITEVAYCHSKYSGGRPSCWSEKDWTEYCNRTTVCK